ncbi:MAG: O-antigen ligase family protein [Planctomycetes bacterium]|nr:O-antigen ligase family protein [Planctomycetota bacterium]
MIPFNGTKTEQDPLHKELGYLEERPSRKDAWILYTLIFVSMVCFAVVAPYRSVYLPSLAMFAGGMCMLLFLIPVMLEDYEVVVLILLTYLPFSKVLPGTFGGLARTFNATNIFLGLSLIGVLLSAGQRPWPLYRKGKVDIWLLLFMFLALLSLIRGFMLTENRDPVDVLFAMKRWVTPMLLYYLVVCSMRSVRQIYYVYLCLCITTAMIGLIGIKKFYIDQGTRSSIEKMRLVATSGPNHLGFLMCSAVFLLVALWWINRKDRRFWLLFFPVLSCVQTMRLTFSRGAQLGMLVGFLTFVFMLSRKWFVIVAAISVFFLLNPDLLPPSISGRLATTVRPGEGPIENRLDKSSSQRLRVWTVGLLITRDYPILGVGYGNFHRRVGSYDEGMSDRDVHSTYLHISSEMGVPALIIFMIVFYVAFREACYIHSKSADDPIIRTISLGFIPMFFATMFANIFGSRFDSVEVSFQIYAMVGVVANLANILRFREEVRFVDGGGGAVEVEVAKDVQEKAEPDVVEKVGIARPAKVKRLRDYVKRDK